VKSPAPRRRWSPSFSRVPPRLPALQPDAQIGRQPQRRVRVRVLAGPARWFSHSRLPSTPSWRCCGGSRRRLAVHHQLHPCRSHIARCAAGCARRPSPSGAPDGWRDRLSMPCQGPITSVSRTITHPYVVCQVSPGSGRPEGNAGRPGHRPHRTGSSGSVRAAIQDRPEHAGRIGARHTQPPPRSARGDQTGVLAVGEKRVVGDRQRGSANHSTRCGTGAVALSCTAARSRRRASCAADHADIIPGVLPHGRVLE